MDKILIPDYRISCHVGVPKKERDVAQDVLIDIELQLDLSQAGRADDFALTVDYAEVCKTVATTVERRPRKLIETIAEEVAEVLLANYPVQAVKVQVRKPRALAHLDIPYAAVVVERHG
ncbi:MAG: dihydroneopterin aldolase [Acidobacteria bacterium]|nr:dihydroneopterin aldolase [Acidobacteriota bacterium]MDA1234997.1 dihydroneopterin aldolase [Acidobacteriota bacterium]